MTRSITVSCKDENEWRELSAMIITIQKAKPQLTDLDKLIAHCIRNEFEACKSREMQLRG